MALEKNYAILEIQKVLLDAREVADKVPDTATDEDMYLEITKSIYPSLEQIFRLVFEPAFNDDTFTLEEDPELEMLKMKCKELAAELDHVRAEGRRLSDELNTVLNANENIHVNFKEHITDKEEQIAWLRKVIGSVIALKV